MYAGKISRADLTNVLQDEGKYLDLESDGLWWIPSGRMFFHPDPFATPSDEFAEARAHFFLPRRYRNPFGVPHPVGFDTSVDQSQRYDLFVSHTRDALDNEVRAEHDYRVLAPWRITDPNGNRSEVAFDTLGLVVATAVIGKDGEGDLLEDNFRTDLDTDELDRFFAQPRLPSTSPEPGYAAELLGIASTRILYDVTRFSRLGEPAFAASIVRETHVSDLTPQSSSKLQVSISYSDGFGREIQKKIQAERGAVPQRDSNGRIIVGPDNLPVMSADEFEPRWVGSGWTVFNNKGKPVRQYEPFFTDRHAFEFDVKIGVSPVLFYDPVERVVATLHPNHTWEKVVFDPWRQETWDVNDTVLIADPKTDGDVGDFFHRLPDADYLPTWHALRTDPVHAVAFAARYSDATDRTNETQAAEKTRVHAATPTVAHADSLGRTFLTVAHNRFRRNGDTIEEFHESRVELDMEGKNLAVIDALGRVV